MGAACTIAFSVDSPLIIGAVVLGGLVLIRLAPRGLRRLYTAIGLISGLGALILTPLLGARGDLILLEGPEIPLLDTQVTLEEVLAGFTSGARVLGVLLLVGTAVALVDADRLMGRLSRVAPRSAVTLSLATRLLPTLERDARALGEAARLRGLPLTTGPRRRRARTAARLALPLLGTSLERGLDVAEAMAARGYGSGPRTHLPERPLTGRERGVAALGALLVPVAAAALLGLVGAFAFYPVAEPVLTGGNALAAGLTLAALLASRALLTPQRGHVRGGPGGDALGPGVEIGAHLGAASMIRRCHTDAQAGSKASARPRHSP